MGMTLHEAIEVLKMYQYGVVGEMPPHSFDLNDETAKTILGGTHYAHMKCTACNHRIPSGMGSSSRRRDNWCNYCGQRIEWEC